MSHTENLLEGLYYIEESKILIMPSCYRFAVLWQCLQRSKNCDLPITRSQNHRDDTSIAPSMTRDSCCHFASVTEFRRDEIRTDEKKNHISSSEVVSDLWVPFLAGL